MADTLCVVNQEEKVLSDWQTMVLDKLVVVNDFYCNHDEVAENARRQLDAGSGRVTSGGNMNVGGIQDSFQRYMSHKILMFPEMVETHRNGSFSQGLSEVEWNKSDWSAIIYLGRRHLAAESTERVEIIEDDGPQLTIGNGPVIFSLDQGEIELLENMLILFRSRWHSAPKIVEGVDDDHIFQVFHFNTNNSAYLARDHFVVLDRLRQYHVVRDALSAEKCRQYIADAERWAVEKNNGSWTRERHALYPTTDIPVSFLPFNDELVAKIKTEIFPIVSAKFLFPVETLNVIDLFIVKYDAAAQSKLDWHRDVSLISFNFALNEDFEGGGTSFSQFPDAGPVRIKQGELVMHTGKLMHSGNNVTKGIRYIIVAFIQVDSDRVDHDFIQRTSKKGITDEALFRNLLRY